MKLNSVQIDSLHKIMAMGNAEVSGALAMLTAQPVEECSSRILIAPAGMNVLNVMNLGFESPSVVTANMQGDVSGQLLFVQSRAHKQKLARILQPVLNDPAQKKSRSATGYLGPDWLTDSNARLSNGENASGDGDSSALVETLSEIANVLFGLYLTAFYDNSKLITFHDIPHGISMERSPFVLKQTLGQHSEESNITCANRIECVIAEQNLELWLILLPQMENLLDRLGTVESKGPEIWESGQAQKLIVG